MSRANNLIEIADPRKFKGKKNDQIMKIVEEIFKKDELESPNSATFSMALDSITKRGTIFKIRVMEKEQDEVEELQ